MKNNNYGVIMAGGVGSRFWPMSTTNHPKQFQDILGTGRTMIQQTYDRICEFIPPENIYVITNKEYVKLCEEQLDKLSPKNIVAEPSMRNTAACNYYMAAKIHNLNPDARLVVLPADHLILKEVKFREKINLALEYVIENDHLVTLGITPTRPETGYGYIQYLKHQTEKVAKVKTFTEKPTLEFAKTFLASGDFLWNAGIFVWSAKTILKSFQQYLPNMANQFSSCHFNQENETQNIAIIYPKVEKISIDNGILEKADNVFVIPSDLGWSDVGTWASVYENTKKDKHNNSRGTNSLLYNAKGNVIRLKNKSKVAIIDGLENYIVVDTDKALLICPLANDQSIKDYVLDVKQIKNGQEFL